MTTLTNTCYYCFCDETFERFWYLVYWQKILQDISQCAWYPEGVHRGIRQSTKGKERKKTKKNNECPLIERKVHGEVIDAEQREADLHGNMGGRSEQYAQGKKNGETSRIANVVDREARRKAINAMAIVL